MEKHMNLTTGGAVNVDVENGKILRITPLTLDDTDAESFRIRARGRTFAPPRTVTVSPYILAHRSLVYSPDRCLYPMKRVDFDPRGARNPQNRGVSGYAPIGWEEALDLVAGELRRVGRESGPTGVAVTSASHQLWGNVGYHSGLCARFRALLGATDVPHNPDSWEGWHWGAMSMWGFSWKLGLPEQWDLLEDALKHTELIVFWSADPETTGGVYGAFESTSHRLWLKELGVEMVFIDPYYNHTAALFSDKWLAPFPGTDAAMATAIAYTWMTEETYDRDYIARRTVGFEDWEAYVLGKTDGVPKTAEWAEARCGVPAHDIRALARKWAKKKTMLAAGGEGGFGGACRTASGNEWARLMVCLAAMQGLGKPGSNIWGTTQGSPCNKSFNFPGYAGAVRPGDPERMKRWMARPKQAAQRLRLPEAVLEGRAEWNASLFGGPVEQIFRRESYPAEGQAPIEMLYCFGGSNIGTMTETNRFVKMYRSENLKCVVSQSVWFEGETKFADVILPACTNYERWDIGELANSAGHGAATYAQNNHRIVVLQEKCIEPLGESRSDYRIFADLCEKLGLYEEFTDGGKTEEDWVRLIYGQSDMPKHLPWEEFLKKRYFVVPPDPGDSFTPALRWFAEERDCDTPDTKNRLRGGRLMTPSGKIEIRASLLTEYAADESDRPDIPRYVEPWEGPNVRALAEKHPLALLSPHPRFSFHTVGDAKDSFINDIKDHRALIDGYYYWIARMNPKDAQARGIAENDIIRLYNDRGAVLCAAQLTGRLPPGVVHAYGSSAQYDPLGEPGASPDRAGSVNILTPKRFLTERSSGMACNSCQIEVIKEAAP